MNPLRRSFERLKWALTPPSRKKRALDEALNLLHTFPDTHALLELATSEGIRIGFSAALIGTGSNGCVSRMTGTGETTIELTPGRQAGELAATLIHELRHVWQNKTMGADAKVLGPEESSAGMSAILTRVREADAFAFTGAMLQQMNFASQVLTDAVKIAKDMMAKNGGTDLSERDLSNISQYLLLSRRDLPPDPKEQMADIFRAILPGFEEYDRKTLKRYHLLYTHPDFAAHTHTPAAEAIDIPTLRKILKCGITPNAPGYLDDLDDKAFTDLVFTGMSPKIRETLSLMDSFEAAAAKGALSSNDNRNLREQIHQKVRDIQAAPLPDLKQLKLTMKNQAGKKQAGNAGP